MVPPVTRLRTVLTEPASSLAEMPPPFRYLIVSTVPAEGASRMLE